MRVTNAMFLNDALSNETVTSDQLYTLTQEASSGYKVQAPSDDPDAYASVVSLDARIATLQDRSTAATTAMTSLSLADGALSSGSDLLVQAKQLAIEMANGTVDPGTRASTASQVNGILQQLIALANTEGSNGYVFGGTATGTPPFDSSGNFLGNNGTTTVEVADGVTAQTNVSGADAFTATGGRDIFADLSNFATALSSNDLAGITSAISNLDSDDQQIVAARATAGDLTDSLQSSTTVISNSLTNEQTQLANTQDADVAQVYSEYAAAQTGYQAALSVTQQILSLPMVLGGG
jgi:flagellar hook-associated protein 3 FlgL